MKQPYISRKEQNIFEWQRYLQILEMRADDRSASYIAKKLGFRNSSSIVNIMNRFQGLEELLQKKYQEGELKGKIALLQDMPLYEHHSGIELYGYERLFRDGLIAKLVRESQSLEGGKDI